jgi:hypothetical protein
MDGDEDDPDHQRDRCLRRGTTGASLGLPAPLQSRHTCKTYLYTASYYGTAVAEIVPDGRDRYVAVFRATTVPCPHRPGEDTGTDRGYSTMTLSWSSDIQSLHGLVRERQVGPCGGGPSETFSYVARRTNPNANPPAEGP